MKFDQLPQIDAAFKLQHTQHLFPFTATVANENLALQGLLYTPPRTDFYYQTAHPKKRIVLHFTAGNTRSDIMSLTQQSRHVSVAFVVARDGTIYQLHPSKHWSGHIGKGIGNDGTNNREDKASIGIEISNYGPLNLHGNNLETVYSRLKNKDTGVIGPADSYCPLTQTEAYIKLDTPFRTHTYFASYTPQQIESTIILLRFLTAKYNIPRAFLPATNRFSATAGVVDFKRIVSHINYRKTGKWDIGPAFDWTTLIDGVIAPTFIPTSAVVTRSSTTRSRSTATSKTARPKVVNEAGIDTVFEKAAAKSKTPKLTRGKVPEATDNIGYNPNDF